MTTVFAAQLNYLHMDVRKNYDSILQKYLEALEQSAKLVLFGRYAMSGYIGDTPTLSKDFSKLCSQYLRDLASHTKDVPIVIGSVEQENDVLVEVIYLLHNGQFSKLLNSTSSCNHSQEYAMFSANGMNMLLATVENILGDVESSFLQRYERVLSHTDILILMGKSTTGCDTTLHNNCRTIDTPSIYMNILGGYGENVFPGGSFICSNKKVLRFPLWKAECKLAELGPKTNPVSPLENTVLGDKKQSPVFCSTEDFTNKLQCSKEFTYNAIMLALRDYVHKNGFAGATLGMSGGIDSALVATLAADALGPENVHTLMMPTGFTSQISIEDAQECSSSLGIKHRVIEIEQIFCSLLAHLKVFLKDSSGTTEENLQSRIRGILLMAVSNSMNLLLLATGNRSELLTGYMTLYGDTCGGFAPLKGVYKTKVYDLVAWRNRNIPEESLCRKTSIIPQRIIERPPSAELKPQQRDQDTLPEYSVLDHVLNLLVDNRLAKEDAINLGCSREDVELVAHLIEKATFKLDQVCKGPSVQ